MTSAIVIGGGIAGCSTAYVLANHGFKVTLIERKKDVAQAASGNPAAMLYPKLSVLPDATSLLGIQGFRFTLNMLDAIDANQQFHASCGQLQLTFDTKTLIQHEKISQQFDSHALPFAARFVSTDEASNIAGIQVKHAGLHIPEAGWANPHAWCIHLIAQPNIETVFDTTALRLERLAEGYRVHGTLQTFEAEHVVLCNAHDACDFLPHLKPYLSLVRGQINFAPPNPRSQHIRAIICAKHFISPSIDGKHTLGATYANHDMTPECTQQDTNANLYGLREINDELPKTLNPNLLKGRVGWRCATMDYLPMVGQILDLPLLQAKPPRPSTKPDMLPWQRGLYVNIGHGSKGMITAPICANWLAGIMAGQAPQDLLLNRLQPNRFAMRELGLKHLAQHIYG